jgi:hypothetical protein
MYIDNQFYFVEGADLGMNTRGVAGCGRAAATGKTSVEGFSLLDESETHLREETCARPHSGRAQVVAGGGEKLHLEVNLNSQVNRCGLSIEDRRFIFSF